MWMLSGLQTEDGGIVCGGDGRADSPGHSAKYGTYTMMELRKKAVIDIQVVQVCYTSAAFTCQSILLIFPNFVVFALE